MALQNTTSGPGNNSANEFTLSISDTNTHDFPDTGGDDESSAQDAYDARTHEKLSVTVVNNQDQDLTASLERADTTADSDFYTDVNSVTVSSGGGVESLVADPDVPLRRFRVTVSFSNAPSGNNDTVVRFVPGGDA